VCERLRLLGVEADGAFAELVKAPAEKVYPIPDSISDEEASIVEPLAVAVHSVSYGEPAEAETAVILGGGPIGLLIAQVLRAQGVERLWVFEVDPYRLSLVKELGFEGIDAGKSDPVGEVMKRTGGRGADVTFDAAGTPETGKLLIPMTGIRGRIVMVALHKKPCEVWFRDLAYREQKILGTRIYAKGDFARAIGLLAEGKVDLKPLVSAVYGLNDAIRAFELARKGGGICKVLIRP
jgi:(R,R)-butanediol dehydrogenase/meso-butanediol dehydrogenase/diacetyl reductase